MFTLLSVIENLSLTVYSHLDLGKQEEFCVNGTFHTQQTFSAVTFVLNPSGLVASGLPLIYGNQKET
jgi:hypothetical protein